MTHNSKYTKQEKTEAYENIKQWRNYKILVVIKSVSASGMHRRISFYTEGGYKIDHLIAPLTEYSYNDKGLSVSGCGMDMIFSVLSNLNYAIGRIETGANINNYNDYFIDASHYKLL